jgi:hypothetical protein
MDRINIQTQPTERAPTQHDIIHLIYMGTYYMSWQNLTTLYVQAHWSTIDGIVYMMSNEFIQNRRGRRHFHISGCLLQSFFVVLGSLHVILLTNHTLNVGHTLTAFVTIPVFSVMYVQRQKKHFSITPA